MAITIGLNSNVQFNDHRLIYKQLFPGATISGNGTLTELSISGVPAGATLEFNGSGTSYKAGGYSFTIANGNITYTGAGVPTKQDWQAALRHVTIDDTSQDSIANGPHSFHVTGAIQGGGTTTSSTETLQVVCFYPGTMIQTDMGEAAVETLKAGDHVITHDGRSVTVRWLGRQTVSTLFTDAIRVLPIRIRKGALDEGIPARDLLVSPDHALIICGVLINAAALVNGDTITRETQTPEVFTYYHIETDDHSLVLAEGAPAETFVDNVDRLRFDNWDEYQSLYPNGKTLVELPYARAKSPRQVPLAVRTLLAERADAIAMRVPKVATVA